MAAGATYEPIATTTLGNSVTDFLQFSSIPSTYTDLRLVAVLSKTVSNAAAISLEFNGVASSVYSNTTLEGTGSTAQSGRTTNIDAIYSASTSTNTSGTPFMVIVDIFSYAGSTFKTVLMESSTDNNGSGLTGRVVGLWRSTSAINSVDIYSVFGGYFSAGSKFTLYGIKAA